MSQLPPSLPGIDIASGLPRVAGNQKLYIKLLRHVAGDAENTKQKLAEALAGSNATAISEVAHSLKGAAANLSITDVAEAAKNVEMAARAGDLSTMPQLVQGLENTLDDFVAVVNTLEGL